MSVNRDIDILESTEILLSKSEINEELEPLLSNKEVNLQDNTTRLLQPKLDKCRCLCCVGTVTLLIVVSAAVTIPLVLSDELLRPVSVSLPYHNQRTIIKKPYKHYTPVYHWYTNIELAFNENVTQEATLMLYKEPPPTYKESISFNKTTHATVNTQDYIYLHLRKGSEINVTFCAVEFELQSTLYLIKGRDAFEQWTSFGRLTGIEVAIPALICSGKAHSKLRHSITTQDYYFFLPLVYPNSQSSELTIKASYEVRSVEFQTNGSGLLSNQTCTAIVSESNQRSTCSLPLLVDGISNPIVIVRTGGVHPSDYEYIALDLNIYFTINWWLLTIVCTAGLVVVTVVLVCCICCCVRYHKRKQLSKQSSNMSQH